jgi:hypothetical protein
LLLDQLEALTDQGLGFDFRLDHFYDIKPFQCDHELTATCIFSTLLSGMITS